MFSKIQLAISLQSFLKPHQKHLCSFSTPQTTTKLTKKTCIFLLLNCKSMKHLKQIHCRINTAGLNQSKDTLSKLMVCYTDRHYGDLNHAERLLKSVHDPCLFMYNLMIRAFAKMGSFRKVVSLFEKLREDRLSPDNFTYPFVLKAMGCLRAVSAGEKTHGFAIKTGFEFDSYVSSSLIDMYAEMGLLDNSQKLFDEMPERDVVSWNVLISGYVRCGRFDEAVCVFRQMEQGTVKPDEVTLVGTLSACIGLRNLGLGKQIHCYVSEKLEFSIVLGNALLDMYCKCGSINLAQGLFDEMPNKNVISWTTMVSGYLIHGQLDMARELFDRTSTRDVVLWTAMINGYVQFSRFDEALGLFREMQIKRIKPDKFTVVTILTVCAHLGALEQGKWIHSYIKGNMIKIDAVVGTALIDMYAKCGCIDESVEVFRRVEEKDMAMWTSVICGLAMNGNSSRALELFTKMNTVGTKPDDVTFIGVLSACSHGGLVEEGCQYFEDMEKIYQIEPKLEHYSCLVDLLGRAGLLHEAKELIEKIPNGGEIIPLWGSLLGACRIHDNVEMGELVAKHLGEMKESYSSGIQTLIANIYAAADRWDDVTKVRKTMKDLALKKIPGCSSIEVNGVVHEFLVADTSHPEIRELYSVLNYMEKPLHLKNASNK